jgi:transmembrane sensor
MNQMAGGHTESGNHEASADRAMQWFVLLQSGQATPIDRLEFQQWISADAGRRREFEKCSRLWGELDSARPLLREELARAALDWECAAERPDSRALWSWSPVRFSSVLASLLVAVIAVGWWLTTGFETEEYRTAKGERRTVILSDGSMVTMNTETVMAAEFSFFKRAVVLREGEALFAVSHEGRRPFEVKAGSRVVRDVGTQFVVRRQNERVIVTVVEGAVEVQRSDPAASWQLIMAGEQISYGAIGALSSVSRVSLTATTAWLEGKVMFEDRPLVEVIQEVGRYQTGEIRILDPRIGALKVSGVFGTNDRIGFLKALERAVPVVVSQVNGAVAVLEEPPRVSETR